MYTHKLDCVCVWGCECDHRRKRKAKQYGCRKPLVREKQAIRGLEKRPVVYHVLINSIAPAPPSRTSLKSN